ncbi:MAG: extracellular solute-binding protein [Clostridiaceae bacterium]|nr:extracellular solute-binding protein [Clostridiaceae bacterium]
MKKYFVIILCLALFVALTTGCNVSDKKDMQNDQSGSVNQEVKQPDSSSESSDTEYKLPLTTEKITLTYFQPVDIKKIGVHTNDYNELLQFKLFEENTGVHIEFMHPLAGQEDQQFNLIVASNQRPDMMFKRDWSKIAGGPQKLVDNGVFMNLKESFEKYSPHLRQFLDEHPGIDKQIKTDEGIYYCYPYIRYDQDLKNFMGYQGRADWLEKLKIAPPQTIAEWENALQLVMETDLDGDGDPTNEIPLIAGLPSEDFTIYGFAGAWGFEPHLYVNKNGKAAFGALQPEYKEYLKTMARWYEKGYIAQDFISMDVQQRQAGVMNGTVAFWYEGLGQGMDAFIVALGGDPNIIAAFNYPTLNEHSDTPMFFDGTPSEFGDIGTAITTNTKYPELCAKWLNYWYTPEGHEIVNFGQEGVTFNWIDGYPKYVEEIANNPDLPVSVALGKYTLGCSDGPFFHDRHCRNQRMLKWDQHVEAGSMWKKADVSGMMPFVSISSDESMEAADIQNEVITYVDEMTLQFILGIRDIDAEFDTFQNTIKGMDIERLLEIYDRALERYAER